MSKIEGLLRCDACWEEDAPYDYQGMRYCKQCWVFSDMPVMGPCVMCADATLDAPVDGDTICGMHLLLLAAREAAPDVEHEDDEPREVPDAA